MSAPQANATEPQAAAAVPQSQASAAESAAPSSDPTPAPQAAAPAIDPAPEASAPVEATERPSAAGIMARLTGQAGTIRQLEGDLTAERQAHARTREELATANARVAEFEAALEGAAQATQAAQAQASEAHRTAAAEAAQVAAEARQSIDRQVSAGVRDTVASLGVEEESLPAAQAQPDEPGKGGEFAHLKGRERAAAAFQSQFANN